jgi:glycopeptide antibiotics resistance protein
MTTMARSVPADAALGAARTLTATLFAVSLMALVWMVVFRLELPHVGPESARAIKLVPFAATSGAGASATWEVVANAVVFVPFGVYLALLAPRWPWWKAASAAAGFSVALELAQFVLATGKTDVTDILMNAVGGLIGFGLAVATGRARRPAATAVAGVATMGVVLVLLAASTLVLGPPGGIAPARGPAGIGIHP